MASVSSNWGPFFITCFPSSSAAANFWTSLSSEHMFRRKILMQTRSWGHKIRGWPHWVHDYHLILLPTLLRRKVKQVKLGFFLHNPFPPSEIYKIMPKREEILKGLLNADVIGFHTFDYARVLSCCSRLLGLHYECNRHIGSWLSSNASSYFLKEVDDECQGCFLSA